MVDLDDEWLTPLKDLSKHNFHGRVWLPGHLAGAALEVLSLHGEGDVLCWHDWMSGATYELTFSSTTKEGIERNLNAVQTIAPLANMHICWKRSGEIIQHQDWKSFRD